MGEEFIWSKLRDKAYKLSRQSGVTQGAGAAGYSSKEALLLGCSSGNANNKISVCAECSLISNLISNGGGYLSKIVIVNRLNQLVEPCGRCDLTIRDFITTESEILLNQGVVKFKDLIK